MITFSIIIPIYKVEKYINECIDSVISQSYQDYEIILVDDGSPDRCPEICDEYAKTDKKIKVIHKENGGLSDARNAGLRIASGKYILFLDSDDFLNKESLKELSDCIQSVGEVDILLCSMLLYNEKDSLFYKNHKAYIDKRKKEVSGIEILVDLIKTQTIMWSVSSSVFRRENLINKNIYFEKNLIGAEDLDFFMNVILHSKTFAAENIDICIYRLGREGSITTNLNTKALYVQLFVRKKWFDYFANLSIDDLEKNTLCSFFSSIYIMKIFELSKFNKSEKHELMQFIKSNNYILNYHNNTKYRIVAKVYKTFGIDFGIRIQKIYHKLFSKK